MSFQELKEQAFKLPKRDRLALVSAIAEITELLQAIESSFFMMQYP